MDKLWAATFWEKESKMSFQKLLELQKMVRDTQGLPEDHPVPLDIKSIINVKWPNYKGLQKGVIILTSRNKKWLEAQRFSPVTGELLTSPPRKKSKSRRPQEELDASRATAAAIHSAAVKGERSCFQSQAYTSSCSTPLVLEGSASAARPEQVQLQQVQLQQVQLQQQQLQQQQLQLQREAERLEEEKRVQELQQLQQQQQQQHSEQQNQQQNQEGNNCSCPGCPFKSYKKALRLLATAKSMCAEALRTVDEAAWALKELGPEPSPPVVICKEKTKFQFPATWPWQLHGKDKVPLTVKNCSTGVFVRKEVLDQQTILLRSQPNKLMTTLLTEVFGYETLQHFNFSTLPTKARDAVIDYVREQQAPNVVLKDISKSITNLCTYAARKMKGQTPSSSDASGDEKNKKRTDNTGSNMDACKGSQWEPIDHDEIQQNDPLAVVQQPWHQLQNSASADGYNQYDPASGIFSESLQLVNNYN